MFCMLSGAGAHDAPSGDHAIGRCGSPLKIHITPSSTVSENPRRCSRAREDAAVVSCSPTT